MATGQRGYSIGTLAGRAGCGVETVRYYERIGLLPRPPRSAGGRRVYGGDDLRRLNLIREMRGLGFPLADVRTFLRLLDSGRYGCRDIRDMADRHLAHLRARIAALTRLEASLSDMAGQCRGGTEPDCPIVEALLEPGGGPAAGGADRTAKAGDGRPRR